MTIKMKALKTFRGKGKEGRVKTGQEFTTETKQRADELERVGLATTATGPAAKRADSPVKNKAAKKGPLRSVGGKTGAD